MSFLNLKSKLVDMSQDITAHTLTFYFKKNL